MTRRTLLLSALPAALRGQVAVSVRAGLVHYIEGQAWAGGAPLDPDSLKLRQLENGEALETRRGRAELLLGPSQFTRLSPHARLTLLSDDINAPELRLEGGSAIFSWRVFAKGEPVQVLTAAGPVRIAKPGVYRFDISEQGASRLRVFEGKAFVGDGQGVSSKRELALADGGKPEKFDPDAMDGFDRWSARRDRVVNRQGRSGRRSRGSGGRGPRGRRGSGVPPASRKTNRLPGSGAPRR